MLLSFLFFFISFCNATSMASRPQPISARGPANSPRHWPAGSPLGPASTTNEHNGIRPKRVGLLLTRIDFSRGRHSVEAYSEWARRNSLFEASRPRSFICSNADSVHKFSRCRARNGLARSNYLLLAGVAQSRDEFTQTPLHSYSVSPLCKCCGAEAHAGSQSFHVTFCLWNQQKQKTSHTGGNQ